MRKWRCPLEIGYEGKTCERNEGPLYLLACNPLDIREEAYNSDPHMDGSISQKPMQESPLWRHSMWVLLRLLTLPSLL